MKVSHESENLIRKLISYTVFLAFYVLPCVMSTFSLKSYNLNYNKIEISINRKPGRIKKDLTEQKSTMILFIRGLQMPI